jgi:type I restriction enzyme S subunit
MKRVAHGGVFDTITRDTFKLIELDFPSLPEQRAIAHILGTLDDKIELNRKMNETLETMALALFKSWFGEENEIHQKILFGDLVHPKKGKNITKANVKEGKVPVVAGGIEPSCYHNMANTKSPVVTVSASGANAGFINLYHMPVWSSDSSFIDNSVTPYVYFSYIFLKLNQETLFEKQEGSAQPHIYPRHVMNLKVPLISEKLLVKYENTVSSWFERIRENIQQNKTLTSVRDILLPKLISGQFRIKDIEKMIGDAK